MTNHSPVPSKKQSIINLYIFCIYLLTSQLQLSGKIKKNERLVLHGKIGMSTSHVGLKQYRVRTLASTQDMRN